MNKNGLWSSLGGIGTLFSTPELRDVASRDPRWSRSPGSPPQLILRWHRMATLRAPLLCGSHCNPCPFLSLPILLGTKILANSYLRLGPVLVYISVGLLVSESCALVKMRGEDPILLFLLLLRKADHHAGVPVQS